MADSSKLKNPFVGLRAFEEEEDYLFFGRSAEINDLLKKFSTSRFLGVVGSSGSGKSSLVISGLLPAIYSGFLSIGRNWRVALLRPGNNPIGNMSHELAKEGVLYDSVATSEIPYEPFIEATLRRSGGGLVQAYRQAHLTAENLLIVVDQFEELFRFSKYEEETNEGKSDALGFINLLLTAAQQEELPIYILLTMRSDFIGDCALFRGLPEAINAGQYLVPRMTRDEIREAITGPIAVGGAKIAPRLLTRLLNDVGTNLDQLPILQHAMMRTWDSWQKKNKPDLPIDIDDYEKIGGMNTALSLHAEEIYAELTTDKQCLTCELIFKALTDKAADVRGIRRPTSVEDLCVLANASKDEVIQIVELFRKQGRTFLMPPPNVPLTNKSIIDISHESLMRVWTRLIKWTEEEALNSEIYLRLSEAAARYEEGKTDLWRNPELAIGLRWYKNNNPTAKWAERYNNNFDQAINFLLNSEQEAIRLQKEKERAARNRRRLAIAVIIASLIIAIGAMVGFGIVNHERNIANAAKNDAVKSDTIAQQEKRKARDSAAVAIDQRRIAQDSTKAAFIQRHIADSLKGIALSALHRAEVEKDTALAEKGREEKAKEKAQNLLREVAASEYQRRIREGPTDEDSIINAGYNYKYYAYCYHLDSLKKIGVANAVKKNDELYDKLYFSLKFGGSQSDRKFVINNAVINNHAPSEYEVQKYAIGKKDSIVYSNNKIKVSLNGKQNIFPARNKVSAVARNDIDNRIFIGTENNVLSVYEFNNKDSLALISTIPMGGNVTAIDYDPANDVIFFGLLTGEIGYIKYHKDKKNQPVYRNDLDFRITALEFFTKNNARYLLATSNKGKAVVYEMGTTTTPLEEFLKENKQLTGIELPENFGELRSGIYLPKDDRIELKTSGREYIWNPFVDELLKRLYDRLDKTILKNRISESLIY